MPDDLKLNKPWLVAVWPGLGHVAISAGYYRMAKLGVHLLAEFSARELFDVEHVEVKGGLIRTGRLPRRRLNSRRRTLSARPLHHVSGSSRYESVSWR